jgi:hypothetical protein
MKYSGFSKNSRLLFAEVSFEFFNNLGSYLQFSVNSRFLEVVHFDSESLPEDYYNYTVVNGNIELINKSISNETINSIKQFSQELSFIKDAIALPNRIYMEAYGNGGFGRYVSERLKSISKKILSSSELTKYEKNLFDYHKLTYDNVTDVDMANLILTQIDIWESKLDVEILNLLKKIDNNVAGGF